MTFNLYQMSDKEIVDGGILEIWDGYWYYFFKSTFLAGRISTPWFFLVWLFFLEIPFVLTIYLSHVQEHRKT